MPQPYVGEIRMFAGTFAPDGWAFCNGQLLSIAGNSTLFQLIGTTYGGDGQTTFALPDLRGRSPQHRHLNEAPGAPGGLESVALTVQQIPVHTHTLVAAEAAPDSLDPTDNVTGEPVKRIYGTPPSTLAAMNTSTVAPSGGSQPHENMQPFLAVNFIISLFGEFPQAT